jgi:RNA polymerase sigma factor (sigma-70 family)
MENIIEAAPRGNAYHRRVKLLTVAEELDLAEQNFVGDVAARNQLVTAHLPLVAKIASKYRRDSVEYDDLVSEGQLGLIRAAQTFDPSKGARFSTYAAFWVKASITQFVERSKSVVKQGYRSGKPDETLNTLAFKDDPGGNKRINTLGDQSQPDPWQQIVSKRNGEELTELALSPLSERERVIFEARHLADEPQTLSEVGKQLGISRERTRQIEATAIRKARQAVEPAITQAERRGRWYDRRGRRDHDVEMFLDEYYRYCTRRARKARR